MECKICKHKTQHIFTNEIMNKYDVKYYQCPNCFFIQTEEPYWLTEAYSSAIANNDLTILERGYKDTIILNQILKNIASKDYKFLDFGGGYGILCRLMRNLGYDYYWYDKFANNIFANGFEYKDEKINLVTCFEVFEHFSDPMEEIKKILDICDEVIITTDLYDDENKLPPYTWSYYSFISGQHISFYSKKTFEFIAEKFNLNYIKINRCWHMLTKNKSNESKLLFLQDISKEFDRYNREFILNNDKTPILKDIEKIINKTK